jgi:hypothetical protein
MSCIAMKYLAKIPLPLCTSFNNVFSNSDYAVSNDWKAVSKEKEWMWKEGFL